MVIYYLKYQTEGRNDPLFGTRRGDRLGICMCS